MSFLDENSAIGYIPIWRRIQSDNGPKSTDELRRKLSMCKSFIEAHFCGDTDFEGTIYTPEAFSEKFGGEVDEIVRFMETVADALRKGIEDEAGAIH